MHINNLERYYKALANRRRLAILKFLGEVKEATVYEIADKINLSFKATSKHLQLLKQVGFVASEQRSLEQYYRLTDPNDQLMKQFFANL